MKLNKIVFDFGSLFFLILFLCIFTESTLKLENDRMHKKIHKLKQKIDNHHREKSSEKEPKVTSDILRLQTERDFFHQEYLRLVSQPSSDKIVDVLKLDLKIKEDEIEKLRSEMQNIQKSNDYELLKMEIRMKDEEIRSLRMELQNNQIQTSRSMKSLASDGSECVQALVRRLERERDCLKSDLENNDKEKKKLIGEIHFLNQSHLEEIQKYQEKLEDLQSQCNRLGKESNERNSARIPGQTQIILLKEENEDLKNSLRNIEKEKYKLKSSNEQLKILLDQSERALTDYQNKYALAENQLGTIENRLTTLDSNRDKSMSEISKLKTENTKLRSTIFELENEKDSAIVSSF